MWLARPGQVQDAECYIYGPGSRILKLVKEVQSDKLNNISTQWLGGDYGPCSRSKVAQNLLQFIPMLLNSKLSSKESHCSQ